MIKKKEQAINLYLESKYRYYQVLRKRAEKLIKNPCSPISQIDNDTLKAQRAYFRAYNKTLSGEYKTLGTGLNRPVPTSFNTQLISKGIKGGVGAN